MTKKKYVKVRGEKFMITMIIIFSVGIFLTTFIGEAMIQSSNSELQRLKEKISDQEDINESIQMKINELASLDNALEVADSYGLEYNSNNIRVVGD